jgi:energy-converting hydrogenase Eha subunit E
MNRKPVMAAQLRKLGRLTLLAFIAKGVVTTSLLVWAVMSAAE